MRLGCTECINPKDYDKPIQQALCGFGLSLLHCFRAADQTHEVLVEMSPTKFGYDYTFDCTGNTDVMRACLEVCVCIDASPSQVKRMTPDEF